MAKDSKEYRLIEEFKRTITTKMVMDFLGLDTSGKLFSCVLPWHTDDDKPSAHYCDSADSPDCYYCFGCKDDEGHQRYDGLDLLRILRGWDVFQACEAFGVKDPDPDFPGKKNQTAQTVQPSQKAESQSKKVIYHPEKMPSKKYYEECRDRLRTSKEAKEYLAKRGISMDFAIKHDLGFDDRWVSPMSPSDYRTPRIIIPVNEHFYTTRKITPSEEKYKNLDKMNSPTDAVYKDGTPFKMDSASWNIEEVTKHQDVWITEGSFDAFSFEILGHHAIAMLGKNQTRRFVKEVKALKAKCRFLIALDNDGKTDGDRAELLQKLKEAGFRVYAPPVDSLFVGELNGKDVKDANDMLQADRAGFEERIKQAVRWADDAQKEELAGYYAKSADATLEAYLKDAEIPKPVYPTNIPALDELLNGGFRAGLILLAAGTGFGKSYAAQQFAGEFAKQGHDVLFFCLEMGSDEMTPRDLSRLTCKNSLETYGDNSGASTALQIEEFYKFTDWGYERQSSFEAAKREYCSTEGKIFYFGLDSHADLNVKEIQNITRRHVWLTGKCPVVFVDYLQLLPALDTKQTTKDAVDQNMRELIKLWHEFNIPLFAICSLNRTNYDEPFSNAALKESGGTEYGANYVIGMQFPGVEYDDFFQVEPSGDDISEENQQKRKSRLSTNHNQRNERQQDSDYATDIQLKITKARKGRRGIVNLKFYSWFGYYVGSLRNDHSNSPVPLVGEPVTKNRVEEIC